MFALPELRAIDLTGNSYTGAIPDGFGGMAALESLMLRGNGFTGTIPGSILGNATIKTLDVAGNGLSGPVPAGLNDMAGLLYLSISDNPWEPGPLPELPGLARLKALSAWGCGLTGGIPESVYALADLQILDLADNGLTGGISAGIAGLASLRLLALGGNHLSGTLPGALPGPMQLDTADISRNELRGSLPEWLASARQAYAHDNYLTGEALSGAADNQGNFCDGAATPQYQLAAPPTAVIGTEEPTNIYAALENAPLEAGLAEKPVLPPGCYGAYIENDPYGKIELTFDESGIYALALDSIHISEGITAVIWILGNEGSSYSETRIVLTTAAPISTLLIDAPSIVAVQRNSMHQFSLIINGEEVADSAGWGIVWETSDTSFAMVDQNGLVTLLNKMGVVTLIATDSASGISSAVALRIS